MKKTPNQTGPSQAVVAIDRLPARFRPELEREPDGRWRAVIKTGREIIAASGDTPDEAAGHALELLLCVLDERTSFPDFLASVEAEDEEITPRDGCPSRPRPRVQ
jgi:hypothetical protein